MSTIEILALSAALGADLFSVAVPIGMTKVTLSRTFNSSLVFALFHIGMILAGYYAGHWLGNIVEHFGAYHINLQVMAVENCAKIIGAAVLILLGFYIIWEKFSGNDCNVAQKWSSFGHPLKGLTLIMLAVSVSIDALAAGFSLGMIEVDLFKLSAILGGVIFIISVTGLSLGCRAGNYIGAKAGLLGGTVLVLLGLHVLWTLF